MQEILELMLLANCYLIDSLCKYQIYEGDSDFTSSFQELWNIHSYRLLMMWCSSTSYLDNVDFSRNRVSRSILRDVRTDEASVLLQGDISGGR